MRTFLLFLITLLSFSVIATDVTIGGGGLASSDAYEYDTFEYVDNGDGTCQILGFAPVISSSSSGSFGVKYLQIPATYKELTVTSIGDNAFANNSELITVTIAEGVTDIGDSAFDGCSNLSSASILGADVVSIGKTAFCGCSRLTSVVIQNAEMIWISNMAFKSCSKLVSVTAPKCTSTWVCDWAFYGCSSLISEPSYGDAESSDSDGTASGGGTTSGTIISSSGSGTSYSSSSSCIERTILSSLEWIGEGAFANCWSLTTIELPAYMPCISDHAFEGCDNLTSIIIPDSVTSIGEGSFGGCSSLTKIVIPDGVTYIDEGAFVCCSSLTKIVVPDSVTYIGENAFGGCSSLSSISLPKNLTSIEGCTFIECNELKEVIIPNSVGRIGESAFGYCTNLSSVIIHNGVTNIEECAFYGCSNLDSINIPESVKDIGEDAFWGCSRLASVTMPIIGETLASIFADIADKVTSISFIGTGTEIPSRYLVGFKSLKSVEIPPSVERIGDYAFYGCWNLDSIIIPEGVTSIGNCAFLGCRRLTSVTIPSTTTSIGKNAFLNCDGLSTMSISMPQNEEGVIVSIPDGVDAANVTVKVSPETLTVAPNGAAVAVVRGENDITGFLNMPTAIDGVIDLSAATVKEEYVKEPFNVEKGAKIDLSSTTAPSFTTAPTQKGLTYRLKEGKTLKEMRADTDGDSKIGDGAPWTPTISEKGGSSAFYTIEVTK